jgi:hypothetical protein
MGFVDLDFTSLAMRSSSSFRGFSKSRYSRTDRLLGRGKLLEGDRGCAEEMFHFF